MTHGEVLRGCQTGCFRMGCDQRSQADVCVTGRHRRDGARVGVEPG